jgi:FKBP-type peptidyl-prolyl cis-trans isomerase 2
MTASEAYGEYDNSKIIEIPLSNIANKDKLIEGEYVGLQHGNSVINVRIIEIKENSVLLDGNPLLAGKNLLYTVKIMDIEKQ